MKDRVITYGKIVFDPPELTNKHKSQADWKKIAMVDIEDDSANLYAWFLKTRFNIELNPPQRGAHVTFINDSMRDLSQNGKLSQKEINDNWEKLKNKWDGKTIKIVHLLDPRTDDNHWWLNIPHEEREELHAIRAEVGLGRPFWGLHMTIGIIHPHFLQHSAYIHKTLTDDVNAVSEHYAKILLNKEIERKKKKRR